MKIQAFQDLQNQRFIFWPHTAARWILVSKPGIEPMPLAVEAQSSNHWIAREFPKLKDLGNQG